MASRRCGKATPSGPCRRPVGPAGQCGVAHTNAGNGPASTSSTTAVLDAALDEFDDSPREFEPLDPAVALEYQSISPDLSAAAVDPVNPRCGSFTEALSRAGKRNVDAVARERGTDPGTVRVSDLREAGFHETADRVEQAAAVHSTLASANIGMSGDRQARMTAFAEQHPKEALVLSHWNRAEAAERDRVRGNGYDPSGTLAVASHVTVSISDGGFTTDESARLVRAEFGDIPMTHTVRFQDGASDDMQRDAAGAVGFRSPTSDGTLDTMSRPRRESDGSWSVRVARFPFPTQVK